ncbi:MAG TPA: hypothetical protein VLX92_29930 [Kofleriaceae bacterium]|nr:hypothetical protein [Kofleriaceae bacterium]
MTLSLVPLLVHETDVPVVARAALRRASNAPSRLRRAYLEVAARSLARDAQLDCDDARELVGL